MMFLMGLEHRRIAQAACAAFVLTLGASARAQDESATVKAWVVDLVTRLQAEPIPQGTLVEYTMSYPATTTQIQVDQWKKEIQGKPDHPLRDRVEQESRRLVNGADVTRKRIAWWDRGLARSAEDMPWSIVKISDMGVAEGQKWSMTEAGMTAADAQTPSGSRKAYNYDQWLEAKAFVVASLRSGGIVSSGRFDSGTIEVEPVGQRWKIRVYTKDRKVSVESEIAFNGSQTVVLHSSIIDSSGQMPRTIRKYKPAEWVKVEGLGWISKSLTMIDESGQSVITSYVSSEPIDREAVLNLSRVPETGTRDLWRDSIAHKGVDDLRVGKRTRTLIDPLSGQERVTPVVFESDRSPLRWIGWVAAGVVSVLVIGTWAVRKRSISNARIPR